MTVETFETAPPVTIVPGALYPVPWPYVAGAVRAVVLHEGARILLSDANFTVAPANSDTDGTLDLQLSVETAYPGGQLIVFRETGLEQGWAGILGARERGLEIQLDQIVMRAQELAALLANTVRADVPLRPVVPAAGRVLMWAGDAEGIVPGPNATDIANAQPNAAAAAASAAAASLSAAQAALFDGKWFDDISSLRADTALTYSGSGPGRVNAGDLIMTRKENAVFRVLGSGATNQSLQTSAGTPVKLAVAWWAQDDRGALARIGLMAQNGADVRMVCYGDSSVLGTDGVTEAYNNWPNRLGSILRVMSANENVFTFNAGSGGKKLIDYWARDNFSSMVDTPYPAAQFVFICFGLNDIKSDTAPVWNPDLFKQRYAELLWQVRLSGRVPIMVTPWLISAAPIRPNPLIQAQLLNAVREVATEQRVDLVDTNAMFAAWQRDRKDQYRLADVQSDGTHFNDTAHILLAQFIAREIYRHRVLDVAHGSRLGPHNAAWSSEVTVSYNDLMNNHWGYSARLVAAGNVNVANEIWVWSDRARRAVYVSPDRSVVSGGNPAYAYVGTAGTSTELGKEVNFGAAASPATERPAENHLYVSELPFGLSRLRFRCGGAGTFEFGGWLVVDAFDPVSVSAYSVATTREVFLPDFWWARPEVVPCLPGSLNLLLNGNLPVGWGAVISSQYVYHDVGDTGPSRRCQSIVAMRTATGADILRVLHGAGGVFSVTSIKTSGSGAWTGQISIHCTTEAGTGNLMIQVRADGQTIAVHNSGGSGAIMSPYGILGGLYRDNTAVTDPAGRQAHATLIPQGI